MNPLLLLLGIGGVAWYEGRAASQPPQALPPEANSSPLPSPPLASSLPPLGVTNAPAPDPSTATGGREWAALLPPKPGPAREQCLLDAIDRGFYLDPQWVLVQYDKGGHQVSFYAAADALHFGVPGDSVRFCATHATAQQIADKIGARLPTSRMSDGAYLQAPLKLNPQTQDSDAAMGDTSRIVAAHDAIDKEATRVGAAPTETACLRNAGKEWVCTERLLDSQGKMVIVKNRPAAANFGWHVNASSSHSPGGLPVIQSVGLAHNIDHVDYSQEICLYGESCMIDGEVRSVTEVLLHPASAWLLSDEVSEGTACRVTRLPAVPPPVQEAS